MGPPLSFLVAYESYHYIPTCYFIYTFQIYLVCQLSNPTGLVSSIRLSKRDHYDIKVAVQLLYISKPAVGQQISQEIFFEYHQGGIAGYQVWSKNITDRGRTVS